MLRGCDGRDRDDQRTVNQATPSHMDDDWEEDLRRKDAAASRSAARAQLQFRRDTSLTGCLVFVPRLAGRGTRRATPVSPTPVRGSGRTARPVQPAAGSARLRSPALPRAALLPLAAAAAAAAAPLAPAPAARP